jgi:hypothetical protein
MQTEVEKSCDELWHSSSFYPSSSYYLPHTLTITHGKPPKLARRTRSVLDNKLRKYYTRSRLPNLQHTKVDRNWIATLQKLPGIFLALTCIQTFALTLIFGQWEIFHSGNMEIFFVWEWARGVHSSVGMRAVLRFDNYGSQKIKHLVLINISHLNFIFLKSSNNQNWQIFDSDCFFNYLEQMVI